MKYLIDVVTFSLMVIAWLLGFVFAKGVFSTIACIFPFYAWYLVAEKLTIIWGMS